MSATGGAVRLEVEGLGVVLSGRRILDGVAFSVEPGRFCAVVGPNGSGKTTLIRSLYRSVAASDGEVRIDGRPQTELDRRALARKVAVLRQEDELAFEFSARELVGMGRSPYKGLLEPDGADDRAVVERCLELCDVTRFADRSVRTLSGGERQRVLLARALAQAPGLLLLDEPTNHLDLFHQLDILGRVRRLGCTVVAALHELELAHRFADDVLVLREGRVEAFGPPDAVLDPERIARVFGVTARRLRDGAAEAWAFGIEGP